MTAKEVMLVSERESTTVFTYKYRQHHKRIGKAKMSAERELNRRGNGRKKNLDIKSLGRELVDGQMTTQMITGDRPVIPVVTLQLESDYPQPNPW